MSKFEKKLCVMAIAFVVIYLGAIGITIQTRISSEENITRLESARPGAEEGQLMLAEIFLPMLILLTVTVCFIIVRKKRAKDIFKLENNEKEIKESGRSNF